MFAFPDLAKVNGIYALDLLNGEHKLYEPKSEERVINVTSQDFLVRDYCFECNPWNLRKINYKTGQILTIYQDAFSDVVSDSTGQTLLVLFDPTGPFSGSIKNAPPGIFRFDFDAGKLVFLIKGSFNLHYESGLGLFQTLEKIGEHMTESVFFDITGQEIFRIKDSFLVSSSPDGEWILSQNYDQFWKLYTSTGREIMDVGTGEMFWAEDSNSFFCKILFE